MNFKSISVTIIFISFSLVKAVVVEVAAEVAAVP
jgi:hypothetical protein